MIKLLILLILFFVIIITLRTHEQFTNHTPQSLLNVPNPISNNTNYGIHSIVNPNDYHLNYYGPKCLNTCILEHVQKVNWDEALQQGSEYSKENILQYNRDHPSENYCHLANKPINDTTTIKNCSGNDCNSNCGSELYSHCIKNGDFCSEQNINYLSGAAILNKTKCSGNSNNCVDKYWGNIKTIKDIYDNNVPLN
tara:strand:- start:10 stop:597 length:588 start_codon:yes stop_codon:yes gene_type:complete